MFTAIYRPNKYERFIGNKQIIQSLIQWLLEWDVNNKKNRCALISGLCGIGKSLLVELVLKKIDYNIVNLEMNESRDKDFMNTNIKPLIQTIKTFNKQENVLVVSDIDSGNDYGFISTLIECIKETQIPIICICDNRYDQSIKTVLPYCIDMKMKKPTYQEIYPLIYDVVMKEKIRVKESQLKNLYEQSNGDIRFMLNTLQFGINFNNNKMNDVKKTVQSLNVFETTGKLLSMDESIESKYETYWLSNDLHTLMVQENYINNALGSGSDLNIKLQNISYTADALSDVDLFDKMVNMANWEFEPHVAMNTINATSKCNKKAMIKFPQFLGRTSTIYKNRKNKQSYAYEFSDLTNPKTHVKPPAKTISKTPKTPKTPKPTKKSDIMNTTNISDNDKKPRGRPKKNLST